VSLLDVLTAIDEGAGEPRAFAVIGAVARNAWAPPRATADLDLAVSARPEVLERLGYRRVREQRADPSDSLPDILIFRRMPVATPEDLVVYKLLADRPRDRDDIRAVGGHQSTSGSGSAAWRRVVGVTGPVSKAQ